MDLGGRLGALARGRVRWSRNVLVSDNTKLSDTMHGVARLIITRYHRSSAIHASVMRGLVRHRPDTLRDVGESVKTVSGAAVPFSSLDDNDDIAATLTKGLWMSRQIRSVFHSIRTS
jgi:hypothetical protein